jgi:hypothetical protein
MTVSDSKIVEGGAAVIITLTPLSAPSVPLNVVFSQATPRLTFAPSTVTFPPLLAAPIRVTVTAPVNGIAEGATQQAFTATVSAEDTQWSRVLSQTLALVDADRAGLNVVVVPTPGTAVATDATVAAAIPGSLMYTPTGQRLAASALTGRQGAGYGLLSDAARRLAVPGGVALSPALQGLLNQ